VNLAQVVVEAVAEVDGAVEAAALVVEEAEAVLAEAGAAVTTVIELTNHC
jgi:hypothetical protein